ncbi:MAG: hypothetical protein MUE46_03805 [Xanthomonadales bacterium]|nr:hypothetical protein [Xanthomonadales bacterium]
MITKISAASGSQGGGAADSKELAAPTAIGRSAAGFDTATAAASSGAYLFFSFPFGITVVVGATGRVELEETSFGGLASFLGFFTILLLRCSPLGMSYSSG